MSGQDALPDREAPTGTQPLRRLPGQLLSLAALLGWGAAFWALRGPVLASNRSRGSCHWAVDSQRHQAWTRRAREQGNHEPEAARRGNQSRGSRRGCRKRTLRERAPPQVARSVAAPDIAGARRGCPLSRSGWLASGQRPPGCRGAAAPWLWAPVALVHRAFHSNGALRGGGQ